jgi:hypothetical protein
MPARLEYGRAYEGRRRDRGRRQQQADCCGRSAAWRTDAWRRCERPARPSTIVLQQSMTSSGWASMAAINDPALPIAGNSDVGAKPSIAGPILRAPPRRGRSIDSLANDSAARSSKLRVPCCFATAMALPSACSPDAVLARSRLSRISPRTRWLSGAQQHRRRVSGLGFGRS